MAQSKTMRSILDFRPVNEEVVATSGAEPSLRDLVYRYYDLYIEGPEAVVLAKDYCEQIESVEVSRAEQNRVDN